MKNERKNLGFILGLVSVIVIVISNIVSYTWVNTIIPYTTMAIITVGLQLMIIHEMNSKNINMDNIHRLGAIVSFIMFMGASSSILYSMYKCAYITIIIMCILALSHLFLFALSYKLINKGEIK